MFLRNSTSVVAFAISLTLGAIGFVARVEAAQEVQSSTVELLSVHFDSRLVAKLDGGAFFFAPGQVAPVHTHKAPAIGYVAKGKILYQVQGRQPVILNEGEAFYEPTGARILRFDNASATDEAIFIDYNFQREGEPFIVFEAPLTEAIDRRDLPTVPLGGGVIEKASVLAVEIAADGQSILDVPGVLVGYVAEGVIELRNDGRVANRFVAGESFSLAGMTGEIVFANQSEELRAKVITISGQ